MIAGGAGVSSGLGSPYLTMVDARGNLESKFGTGGHVSIPVALGSLTAVVAISVRNDGEIWGAYRASDSTGAANRLVRLGPTGILLQPSDGSLGERLPALLGDLDFVGSRLIDHAVSNTSSPFQKFQVRRYSIKY